MKFITDMSKGVLGVADSVQLWEDIVSRIPDEVLLRPGVKILSVACGQCTEAVVIARRMMALGIDKQQVRDSIWLIDKYPVFTSYARKKLGFTNVITGDFLKTDFKNMRFDVVAQNPPYLKGKWKQFIKNSWDNLLTDDGVMVTVNPDPIESIGKQSKIWHQECRRMNLQFRADATHYFPTVNSGPIGMFYYNKRFSYNNQALESNEIKHVIKNKMIDNSKKNTTQRYSHLGKYDHLREIKEKRKRNQKSDMKDHSLTKINQYSESVIVGMVSKGIDVRYFEPVAEAEHGHLGSVFVMNRFFGQNTESESVENIENHKIGRKVLYLEMFEGESLESFQSVFCSPLYRFTLKVMRDGHMDTRPTHLTQLYCPPLNKIYTLEELYDLNGITDINHRQYIEDNYLGNKWK
jgi:hypothetical protein